MLFHNLINYTNNQGFYYVYTIYKNDKFKSLVKKYENSLKPNSKILSDSYIKEVISYLTEKKASIGVHGSYRTHDGLTNFLSDKKVPFVCGPSTNIYNARTLGLMQKY